MYAVVSSALLQKHVVSHVYNFHFLPNVLLQLYPVRRRLRHIPMVHGLSSFHHLFVKVNDAYVRIVAQFLLPFAASNDISWKGSRLYA